MEYLKIGSSSKGNSILLQNILLLDCGVTYVKVKPYLKQIKLIFISHSHKDHLLPNTVKQISYNYPNIKFICGSKDLVGKLVECGVKKENVWYLNENKWYSLGAIKVRLEPLEHDAPNHLLKIEYKNEKCIYIVDTANVDDVDAKEYDLYLIESNYREDILKKHIEECEDDGTLYYLDRVPKTHLSYEQANSFLIENMGKNSMFDYIHQSSYNFEEME